MQLGKIKNIFRKIKDYGSQKKEGNSLEGDIMKMQLEILGNYHEKDPN